MDSRKEYRAQEWTHMYVVSSWKSNQERTVQRSAGHRQCLLRPHFSLLQRLPAGGHWGDPAPLSLDAAPLSRSPSPDGPEETKPASWSPSPVWRQSPLAGHRAQSEGKASCARRSEGDLAPPAGRQRRAGSPVLREPRGLTQKQLCCEHSDWKTKLKCSRISYTTLLKTWLRNSQSLYGMQP